MSYPAVLPSVPPAASPGSSSSGNISIANGNEITFDVNTNALSSAAGFDPHPTGSNSDPSNSSPVANYGISGALNVTPIVKEPSRLLKFPSPSRLVTFIDRYLPRIKEKSGIATFTVFDTSTGTRKYRTINFFCQGVTIDRSESISIVKTNRGFTLYSPDSNPVGLTMTGTLLNGNDWSFNTDQAKITHTDWVAKFLSDYDQRLSATAAIRNKQTIFFSFENIFAEVHVASIGTAVSSDDPLVSPLRVSMVAKELRVTYRPDIPDPGLGTIGELLQTFADLSAAGEKLAQIVANPPGLPGFGDLGGIINFTPNVLFNTSSQDVINNITEAAQQENLDAFVSLFTRPREG